MTSVTKTVVVFTYFIRNG